MTFPAAEVATEVNQFIEKITVQNVHTSMIEQSIKYAIAIVMLQC